MSEIKKTPSIHLMEDKVNWKYGKAVKTGKFIFNAARSNLENTDESCRKLTSGSLQSRTILRQNLEQSSALL